MGDIYTVCRWMRNTFGRDNADVGGMRKMVAQMITNVHYVCPAMNVRMRQLNERRI